MKPLAQEWASSADNRHTRIDRVDAVVICSDDTVLIELGPLLGERYRTHTVDAPADIADAVSVSRWIGIVDVDSLADARAAVARLETQFPRCPLILIASKPGDWSAALTRGAAVALIGRQDFSGPRLNDALGSAESRLRSDTQPSAPATAAPPSRDAPSSAEPRAAAPRGLIVAIAIVALVGVVAAGGWWMTHQTRAVASAAVGSTAAAVGASSSATAGAAESTTTSPSADKPQGVLELLSAARVAFREQKLLLPRPDSEPRGDSALELYAQVITQDPGNDEATDGVKRLFAVGKARIQQDIAAGKLDDASRLVGLFRDAGIGSAELSDLSANIAAARPKWLEARAADSIAAGDLATANQLLGQLTASGADAAAIAQLRQTMDLKGTELQLQPFAAQMRAAISAGNLLSPPGDALSVLNAMRALSRTQASTIAAQRELQTALLARVNDAVHQAQFDSAQRYLTAATDLGASAQLDDTREALRLAQATAARARAMVAQAASAPAVRPPASVAAPAPVVQAPSYLAARPTRALSVTYPAGQSAQGFVVVEFMLQPNGSAKDAAVVASDLPAIFGRIATAAVSRGRYDTHDLIDAQPVRARLRLRFRPQA